MRRITIEPRPNWQEKVESKGLSIHSLDGRAYWNESACYLWNSAEIETLEAAITELYRICVEATGVVIERGLWERFGIPVAFADLIKNSWESDSPSLYGRFDLSWNGNGPPKLLEFNADTPTSLVEAGVIQWFWLEDQVASGRGRGWDQFNSIHEQLIESWMEIAASERITKLHVAAMTNQPEDMMTAVYMLDVARQGGLECSMIDMSAIGYNPGLGSFMDLANDPIEMIFKLYPWEWMIREKYGREISTSNCLWLEPPWKMIMSSKAILPMLWELFPNHPNLLWAGWEKPGRSVGSFVSKPIYGREGSNVLIETADGKTIESQDGPYGDGPFSRRIYQAFAPLPDFQGLRPVIGGWVVGGNAAGMGIREDDGLITSNFSRFVPHAIEN